MQVYLREGRVLTWQEESWLTCEEYLGGVFDFSGIGFLRARGSHKPIFVF
jgi:hypothetical protein